MSTPTRSRPSVSCAACGARWALTFVSNIEPWNASQTRWCPDCRPAARRVREFLRRAGFTEREGGAFEDAFGATILADDVLRLIRAAHAQQEPGAASWHEAARAAIAAARGHRPSRGAARGG